VKKTNKIAIVTPLKNEIDNLSHLISSIKNQKINIHTWVIVENGSTDGSKEYLQKILELDNVSNFFVLNFSLPNDTYELGFKYSTVVNQGFKYIKEIIELGVIAKPDFIGICDADCFPNENYFYELTAFMNKNDIAISSGVGVFEDGKPDGEADNWVRGNCRLWKWECFIDCGYIVGPSADALSLGKAELNGYHTKPNHSLIYKCREMGQRTRYDYYGYSSYYRGITLTYAVLKFFNFIRIGQASQGVGYLRGYISSLFSRKDRLDDIALRTYFSKILQRKIVGLLRYKKH
jgi:glycosyltransferase involved in cell wall biosynthesis